MRGDIKKKLSLGLIFPCYIWGTTGTGKSCLAGLMLPEGEWIDTAKAIRVLSFSQVDPLPWWGRNVPQCVMAWHMMKALSEYPGVVFDDFGTRTPSEMGQEMVLEMVRARERRPTVYTGNLSPGQLAKVYDDRVVDRICCGTVIEISGPSMRTGI